MDKLTVELQDGYFVEIDSLNHTLRQRYAGQDKDGNEKESVRTIGYFGDMKQCIKALLERYPREAISLDNMCRNSIVVIKISFISRRQI